MTTENKLKELILQRYSTMTEFSKIVGIPQSTIATIMSRGIGNASIGNVIKICQTLQISTDELANGRIVPIKTKDCVILPELPETISYIRGNLDDYSGFTIDGKEITREEWEFFLHDLSNSVDFIRKWRNK